MLSDMEAQFLGVYRVKDIQEILQIGQVAAYRLIHSGDFPVIAVGRSYRIPRKEFHEWLHRNRGPVKYRGSGPNAVPVHVYLTVRFITYIIAHIAHFINQIICSNERCRRLGGC